MMIKADSSTQLNKGSKYIALFLSSFCFLIMIVPTHNMMRYILLYALFMLVVLRNPLHLRRLWTLSKSSVFFSLLALALGVWKFTCAWNYNVSVLLPSLSEHAQLITALIGLILAFLGSFFLASIIDTFVEKPGNNKERMNPIQLSRDKEEQKLTKRNDIIICLFMAVAVITVCNMCSPLYPTNPWVSPACYHTVGKSLWSGMMPYRDLYEHKGPLMYALHSIATLISYRSFFGMYLLLIPFAFFFFYYSRKTIRLFTNQSLEPWFPVICVGAYTIKAYHTGDSAEEMAFPFMAYSIYVAFRYLKNDKSFSTSTGVAIGVCVSVILWTKFNLLFFYVPWFLFLMVDMLQKNRLRHFFCMLKNVFWGFLAVTFPIVVFYAATGALASMIDVYFLDNLSSYLLMRPLDEVNNENTSYLLNLFGNISGHAIHNMPLFVMLILGLFAFYKTDKRCFFLLALLELAVFILVFVKYVVFVYYPFLLAVFIPFGILPFCNIQFRTKKACSLRNKVFVVTLSAAGFALILCGTNNLNYMFLPKDEYVQFRFAKTIMKEENPTLMNYHCQDQGVFAVTGILPINRFYCDFNNDIPGKYEDQERVVKQRLVDFLISNDNCPIIPGYTCIDSLKSFMNDRMFYLHRKRAVGNRTK